MSNPFSIATGVVRVAELAYSSCKALNDMIKRYLNAPQILSDLCRDLEKIQSVFMSLIGALNKVENSTLSPGQQSCLISLEPAIRQFKAAYDEFTARPRFSENEISLMKAELEMHKQTLDIALGIATFQNVRQNRDSLQSLETKIATSMSKLTGNIEGLDFAMRSLSLSNVGIRKEDVDMVVKVLNEHDMMLKQCLKVCQSGFNETMTATGTTVKYAEVSNKARQWIGNMGYDGEFGADAPPVSVDRIIARDDARQGVGNLSKDAAKEFWS